MQTITFKPILPGKFNAKAFDDEFLKGMNEVRKLILSEFMKTVETWNAGEKPDFIDLTYHAANGIISEVYTRSLIYKFVTGGTKTRHAVMTEDFIPKTMPGIIGSGRGRGSVKYISKKVNKPGIQARNFDKVIAKKTEPTFKSIMNNALRAAVKRCGHAM